jgi:AraC-like DNA-binding protein
VEAVNRLLEDSARAAGQECFGLLMAKERRISNLGAVGLLYREAPTVRAAMQIVERYRHTHNESLLHRIDESAGIATIYEDLMGAGQTSFRQGTELVIGVVMRMLRLFLGPDWKARRICFIHAAPADLSIHRRVLGQTPEFNCEFNGIVCTSQDLDTTVPTADPVMADYIRLRLGVDHFKQRALSDEVKQITLTLMPQGRCTADHVAALMGISRSTLSRQLADEGQTFSAVVQSARTELAQRYVLESRRTLADIAQLLGFSYPSAFSRWYKVTFGACAAEQRLQRSASSKSMK